MSEPRLAVTHRTEGEFLVIIPRGRLDTSATSRFEDALGQLLAGETVRIILDCSAVSYASSAGLRVFLALAKRMKKAGGCCRFAALTAPLMELFEISGFVSVLEIHESVEEALR